MTIFQAKQLKINDKVKNINNNSEYIISNIRVVDNDTYLVLANDTGNFQVNITSKFNIEKYNELTSKLSLNDEVKNINNQCWEPYLESEEIPYEKA